MKTPTHRLTALLVLALCVPALSGCPVLLLGAGAAGGVAGTAYVRGKLEAELEASVPQVHRASVAGLKSLDLPVTKSEYDKLAAAIESKSADDKTIRVTIDSLSPNRSRITIRVGLMGDEAKSRTILDAIRARL